MEQIATYSFVSFAHTHTHTFVLQTNFLSFQFEGNANLVTASIKVLAIDQSGQRQNDTGAQFLLIAETDLADIVNLSPNGGVLVQIVLATDAELGVVRARAP